MFFRSKKNILFLTLAMFLVANAVVAEMIGGKLFTIGPFTMSIGVIPWPIVFIATDLINEYFGRDGVRKISFITAGLIIYAYVVLFFAMNVKAASFSPIQDDVFQKVFGQSMWIIAGSILAFLVSQIVDNSVFWILRDKTGGKMIWLRATGSTVVSQLVDTFIVGGVAFWLPAQLFPEQYKMTTAQFLNTSLTAYTFKLAIAICATPLIYIGHSLIDKYLGKDESHEIIRQTAEESLHHKVEE